MSVVGWVVSTRDKVIRTFSSKESKMTSLIRETNWELTTRFENQTVSSAVQSPLAATMSEKIREKLVIKYIGMRSWTVYLLD